MKNYMSYSEANFQSDYNIWKRHNLKVTCAEELKITKTNVFYFNSIEPHQLLHLTTVKHDFFQYKIPDLGNQNPFDSFSMYKEPAYVGVLFYKPRKKKIFYLIDIDVMIGLIDDCKVSLTEDEVRNYAAIKGVLK